jgi:tRNA modification GTPase
MVTDPIAAIATPPGRSAIAVVRLSGRGAWDVAARVVKPFATNPLRTARRARAVDPESGAVLDDILYAVFAAPASYTGEDLVEISTHGGLLVPAEVLTALLAAGARLAAPGEFTSRAVANGKLDLLQAEAIADLVDATSAAQRRAALGQLDRGLSDRIGRLREQVLGLEALVSYEIDFPEEDDGPVPASRVMAALTELREALAGLLATSREGERLRDGALAVIAGAPNVGKSSLFNALLGTARAIVTDVPGTTRDAIEAPAVCGGFPFRLVDTAGLHEHGDRLERLGIEVSRRYLAAADVVLCCVEAGRAVRAEERAFLDTLTVPVVVVRTKLDVVAHEPESTYGNGEVAVSALTGEGIAALRTELARVAFAGLVAQADATVLVTRERQRLALGRALTEIDEFARARAGKIDAAAAGTHLRAAVTALEDVIGLVTSDDVLDRVFAAFCVGK